MTLERDIRERDTLKIYERERETRERVTLERDTRQMVERNLQEPDAERH